MNSPHLHEETLIALLFDEADPQAQRHLSACALCQARLRELADFYDAATAKLHRALCPDPHALIRYLEGRLPATQAQQVKAHLDQCSLCQEDVAELMVFIQRPGEARDAEPDRSWWAAMADGVRRLFRAQLIQTPHPHSIRGDGPQFFHYHTPEFDVLLSIMPAAPGTCDLIGQITPLSETGEALQGRVRIEPASATKEVFPIDDTGGFQIDQAPAGAYHLFIELYPDVLIELDVHLMG